MPEAAKLINRCPFCNTWNPSLQFAQSLTEIPLVAAIKYVVVSCGVLVSTPEQWEKIASVLPSQKIKHPNWDRHAQSFIAMMGEIAEATGIPQPRATEIVQGLVQGIAPPKELVICGAILGVHIQEFVNFAQRKFQ